MRLVIEKSVTVITPSIGQDSLKDAMVSVSNQDYGNLKHLIVIDGPEYFESVMKHGAVFHKKERGPVFTCAPYNTGQNGFYGHRIYAAYPHLINTDYIAFLDEDNWIDPNHISSMVELLEKEKHDWVHSLRKVYINDKYLADDNCESIGRWPIWFSKDDAPQHLVDTSSYLFKTSFLIHVCNHWHHGWGGDRRFFNIVTKQFNHQNYGTTGLHTLNYKLPDMNKAYGGDLDFFKKGNKAILEKYNGKYPWQ